MSVKILFRKSLLWAGGGIFLLFCLCGKGDSSDTNSASHRGPIPLPAPKLMLWGKIITNDIMEGLSFDDGESAPMITVWLRRMGKPIPIERLGNLTNHLQLAPLYLGASNQFCGPIEMQDDRENPIPLLKPEVSSSSAYPKHLSWSFVDAQAHKNFMLTYVYPLRFSTFLLESQPGVLGRFLLDDYFKTPLPGDYKLTVWPMIYLQSKTDPDYYERLNLPPLRAIIHRDQDPAKWQASLE